MGWLIIILGIISIFTTGEMSIIIGVLLLLIAILLFIDGREKENALFKQLEREERQEEIDWSNRHH